LDIKKVELQTEKKIILTWHDTKKPNVSVLCATYNHENYIEDAIKGFLLQETNFAFEIIIHDDASTDNTQKIVQKYQAMYPNIIKPIFQTENQYSKGNFRPLADMIEGAEGDFLALCEGDDYWTDPLKLQKQVDFLEKNQEYSICFHNVKIFDQTNSVLTNDDITREVAETTTIEDLAHGNYMHTPSVVFRNNRIIFPESFCKSPVGDYFIHMLNAKHGKIKKMDDCMGVYRVHSNGVWSQQEDRRAQICLYLTLMVDLFSGDVKKVMVKRLVEMKYSLFQSSGKTNLTLLKEIIDQDSEFAREKIGDFKYLNQYSFTELLRELYGRVIRKMSK